jgi:hypothetical protein
LRHMTNGSPPGAPARDHTKTSWPSSSVAALADVTQPGLPDGCA